MSSAVPETAVSVFVGSSNRTGVSEMSQRAILGDLLKELKLLSRSDIYVHSTPDDEQWVRDILPESEQFHVRLDGRTRPTELPAKVEQSVEDLFESGYENVIALAADTPGLGIDQVRQARERLEQSDQTAVVGPAGDGGFYLLGLNEFREGILEGVPFYVGSTYRSLMDRLGELYRKIEILGRLNDIDRTTDWLSIQRRWLNTYRWIVRLVRFLVFGEKLRPTFRADESGSVESVLSRTNRSPPLQSSPSPIT